MFSYFLPKERRTHGVFVEFGVRGCGQCNPVGNAAPMATAITDACVQAGDGIQQSNSYFFEKHLCWTGLCVEPRSVQQNTTGQGGRDVGYNHHVMSPTHVTHSRSPAAYKQLVKNRPKCHNINGAICNSDGPRTFIGAV